MITKGSRVQLTALALSEAQWKYRHIGTRLGTVIQVGNWPVVCFDGIDDHMHLPPADLEAVDD